MKRTDEGVVLIERDSGSSLWWFLIGGALGAGLALLFAPHSGEHTRRVVGRRLTKLRDAADQALTELKEAISPEDRVHRSLAESEEEDSLEAPGVAPTRETTSEEAVPPRRGAGGGGASSARRELEQRLAEARARRQKALMDADEEPVA